MESKLSQPLSPGSVRSCTSFSDEPMTGRTAAAVVRLMIRMCFSGYIISSESCPRSMVIVGYGRCLADRQNLMVCLRSTPNVFTVSCARMCCCLSENPLYRPRNEAYTGRVAVKENNQRWCSDGFEFRCDNREKLRVTFALDCCDREALHWAVTTGDFDSETVQDAMPGAVERRFGSELPASPVEWLTDNGSCYRPMTQASSPGCWDLNRRTRRCGVRRVTK